MVFWEQLCACDLPYWGIILNLHPWFSHSLIFFLWAVVYLTTESPPSENRAYDGRVFLISLSFPPPLLLTPKCIKQAKLYRLPTYTLQCSLICWKQNQNVSYSWHIIILPASIIRWYNLLHCTHTWFTWGIFKLDDTMFQKLNWNATHLRTQLHKMHLFNFKKYCFHTWKIDKAKIYISIWGVTASIAYFKLKLISSFFFFTLK